MYISRPILFLLALGLLALILFTCNHVSPTQVGSGQVDTSSWRNGAGDLVTSLAGRPEAFANMRKEVADSLAKVYGTRISKLTEYIIANQRAQVDLPPVDSTREADYFPPVIHGKDTCPPVARNLRQSFANPWYHADVQLGDSPYLHLDRRDTLTAIWKTKRRYIQLDLSSADTSNRIYGVQAYRKYLPPKRWGIGLVAGYGATMTNPVNLVPFVGIGINYSLIKF